MTRHNQPYQSIQVVTHGCQVQEAMLQGMWNKDVLALPNCGAAGGSSNDILWYGPRVRMGLYEAEPTRVVPHSTSGRADYFGPLVNRYADRTLMHATAFALWLVPSFLASAAFRQRRSP